MHTQVQSAQPAATGGLQFESHLPRQQRLGQLIQIAQAESFEFLVEVREKLGDDEDTVLMVISDHGFCNFRRGVNLNTWLRDEGYLVLKEGETTSPDWFANVDWEKTRAFTLGLIGRSKNTGGQA